MGSEQQHCSTVLKFADDTKLVARVGLEEDRERLKQDLIELFKWSEDWQMLFNLDKCAVMHFGLANEGMEVRLGRVTRCWVRRRVKGIWELSCRVTWRWISSVVRLQMRRIKGWACLTGIWGALMAACLLVEPPALVLVFIYQARLNAIYTAKLS